MLDESKLESRVLHLVRPKDLNHHGTLFAGQMAKWCIEAGLMAVARLIGKPEDVVCVKFDHMIFKKPVRNGEIIEIKTRISQVGSQVSRFLVRCSAPVMKFPLLRTLPLT